MHEVPRLTSSRMGSGFPRSLLDLVPENKVTAQSEMDVNRVFVSRLYGLHLHGMQGVHRDDMEASVCNFWRSSWTQGLAGPGFRTSGCGLRICFQLLFPAGHGVHVVSSQSFQLSNLKRRESHYDGGGGLSLNGQ